MVVGLLPSSGPHLLDRLPARNPVIHSTFSESSSQRPERKRPSDTLEALLVNDSFRRWVLSRASQEEQVYWEEWLTSRFDNQRMADEAAQIIYLLQFNPVPVR